MYSHIKKKGVFINMKTNNSTVCFKETRDASARFGYYLLLESFSDEAGDRDSYSIKAEYSRDDGDAVSCTASDLTTDEATAFKYFKMISEGLVTPTTLLEVAEDLISSL